jgi:hypothetical protein
MARRYTRINAVCQSHKTAMEEEVKKILGVENETSAQDYFEKCTAAAKQVYENMDAVEKHQVDNDVKNSKEAPNKLDIQQRWVQSMVFN